MKKLLIYALVLVLLLCSCGGSPAAKAVSEEDFVFECEQGKLYLNKSFKPDDFGEYSYYEAQSCGYDGLDKIYTYGSFEVYTYPSGANDFISYIDLFEGAKTSRGIGIGSALASVKEAYGEDCSINANVYTYALGDKELCFTIDNDIVSEIEYAYNGQ